MMPHEADVLAQSVADSLINGDRVELNVSIRLLMYMAGVSSKAQSLLDHVVAEAMRKEDQPLLQAMERAGLIDVYDILGS